MRDGTSTHDCDHAAFSAIVGIGMGATEARVGAERDLFEQLLEARATPEPRAAIHRVLALLVNCTRAARAYLEVYPPLEHARPHWSVSHGCTPDEEAAIQSVTSRGIVAAALASGTTLHTPFAALDARFEKLPSVRDQRLEAVLCVPLGGIGRGVLYLEGARSAGPFAADDVSLTERVARHIWPSLDRIVRSDAGGLEPDPTRPYRARLHLHGIVGRSAALARVFAQLEPCAPLDITVLLTGANGTGKTQLARAIHDNSARREGPFVELNCAAIPENLLEPELFGTVPGGFSGAVLSEGKILAASGGTLFLDEIAEVPVAAQSKLLQFLQSREFYAVGSNKLKRADIRLVAATNVDLPRMVAEKRFREDLYFRLNVIRIHVPSLAERRADIGVLVDELLARAAREHRLPSLPASVLFRGILENRDWPGNIRELRSVVERALVHAAAEGAPQVEMRHQEDFEESAERALTFHEATRRFQRELLAQELDRHDWNVKQVSDRLEITRAHVYNLINQLELRKKH